MRVLKLWLYRTLWCDPTSVWDFTLRGILKRFALIGALLLMLVPWACQSWGSTTFVWKSEVTPGANAIHLIVPADVQKVLLAPDSGLEPLQFALSDSEASVAEFWEHGGRVRPKTERVEPSVIDPTTKNVAKGPAQEQKSKQPDPELSAVPTLSCDAPPSGGQGPFLNLEMVRVQCQRTGAQLALIITPKPRRKNELDSMRSRSDVWLIPYRSSSVTGGLMVKELLWTRIEWTRFAESAPLKISPGECQEENLSADTSDSCQAVNLLLEEPRIEDRADIRRALAGSAKDIEHKVAPGVLRAMVVLNYALIGICVAILATGLLTPGLIVRVRRRSLVYEVDRIRHSLRRFLQYLEAIAPATAFALTTVSLLLAFLTPAGTRGQSAFRQSIGMAMAATMLGLGIRVFAHTADRLLEHFIHWTAGPDGVIDAMGPEPSEPTPPTSHTPTAPVHIQVPASNLQVAAPTGNGSPATTPGPPGGAS